MNCTDVKPLLAAFGDGSLSESVRRGVEQHARSCRSCQSLMDRRARLKDLLVSSLPVPEPGDVYFERQRARLLEASNAVPAPRGWAFRAWFAAGSLLAASALLVLYGPTLVKKAESPRTAPVVPPLAVKAPMPAPPPLPGADHPERKDPSKEPLKEPVKAVPVPAPAIEPKSVTSTDPAPPSPAVVTPAPRSGVPPGTAERTVRMTREAVEVALAETPTERVVALCVAAEAQLRELPVVMAKDPTLAAELAAAYRLLVAEGVAGVLGDKAEREEDLAPAREVAARRARDHETTLAALQGEASGALKDHLGLALEASRSLSGR